MTHSKMPLTKRQEDQEGSPYITVTCARTRVTGIMQVSS
jgi:hypothetical protein